MYNKEYYQAHKEQKKEYYRKWREKNRNKIKIKNKKWYENNKEKIYKYQREYHHKMRDNALNVVGNGLVKCSNCGCSEKRILEINHKLGNGSRERRNYIGGREQFYKDIINGKRDIDDLEILCKLCNIAYYIKQKYNIDYDIEIKPSS